MHWLFFCISLFTISLPSKHCVSFSSLVFLLKPPLYVSTLWGTVHDFKDLRSPFFLPFLMEQNLFLKRYYNPVKMQVNAGEQGIHFMPLVNHLNCQWLITYFSIIYFFFFYQRVLFHILFKNMFVPCIDPCRCWVVTALLLLIILIFSSFLHLPVNQALK